MELVRCRMCGGEAAHAEYVTSMMCVVQKVRTRDRVL